MHTGFDIIQYSQFIEQTNILESTCHTGNISCDRIELRHILATQTDCTSAWLIYLCQHIEYSSFTCTIHTKQAKYLSFFYLK